MSRLNNNLIYTAIFIKAFPDAVGTNIHYYFYSNKLQKVFQVKSWNIEERVWFFSLSTNNYVVNSVVEKVLWVQLLHWKGTVGFSLN